MNARYEHAINHTTKRFCFHCLNEVELSDELNVFSITGRGYGSNFDSMNFDIELCEHCTQDLEIEKGWFDNEVCFNDDNGEYKYELYIINLIETFNESVQDMIYNA